MDPPPGPTTLSEAMEWPSAFVRRLDAFDDTHGTEFRRKMLKRRVVLTSCFSGSGGAETALAMLMAANAQQDNLDLNYSTYSFQYFPSPDRNAWWRGGG